MKFCRWMKDGGPESHVEGFFFIEIKRWFSIVLLRFDDGSRDAYHSHAFNSTSWVLRGLLEEHLYGWPVPTYYVPSIHPVHTYRETFHKVISRGTTWVLSFRGPWSQCWFEALPAQQQKGYKMRVLRQGRQVVA